MIRFRSYASGSAGNLYTVSDGITTIMLDCGLTWRNVQRLLNFKTSSISAVLAGHYHQDHVKGVPDAAKHGLDIYASRETFENLNLTGHRFHNIEKGKQFSVGTWTILPFATIHDVEGSLAFYMTNKEGESFLYLTDSAYSEVKFKNLSVIACECNFIGEILSANIQSGRLPAIVGHRTRRTHFSLETLVAMLLKNDLSQCRKIYLLHLSDGNSDEAWMIREVQEATGIPTYAAN